MEILTTFIALLCGVVGTVVLLSYAFVWYEFANRDPRLLENRFAPERLARAAGTIILEATCLLLTVLQHPLGWFPARDLPAESGGETPVLLLHGLFHNRACWNWTRHHLRRRGRRNVHAINLPPWHDVEDLTTRVARKVDEMCHASGIDKVHLVGHSMGGIIARNYLQLRGGAAKVASCTLIATPNHGSKLAPFALTPLGRLLLPGSEFLRRLTTAPLPPEVRVTSLYSRHDNMVLPWDAARLEGADNREFSGMGHMTVLYHPEVFAALLDALQEDKP